MSRIERPTGTGSYGAGSHGPSANGSATVSSTETARLDDLLTAAADQGLTDPESADLTRMLDMAGLDAAAEQADMERAAAVLAVSMLGAEQRDASGADDVVPEHVLASLGALAHGHATGSNLRLAGSEPEPAAPAMTSPAVWSGWIAAAACLLVAVILIPDGGTQAPDLNRIASITAVQRADDYQSADWLGLDDTPFSDSPHPLDNELAGKVEWSDSLNDGYMTISGLAQNDPEEFVYQLWIFDAERPTGKLEQFASDAFPILSQIPVDGGVFSFEPDETGTAVVRIDPKLPVRRAAVFAITKERPGGVVVSDRDIVFLAIPSVSSASNDVAPVIRVASLPR
ncbi:MAG: anti-sigma factor [Planctomycetota bacterium]